MNQACSNTVSPFTDRSYEKYVALKSARLASKTSVQIDDSLQAELNAAAWVTVHDGHDFSARVLVRITSCPESGEEIKVFVSADNSRCNNVSALRIALPAAGERGSVRMPQRVPMAAQRSDSLAIDTHFLYG